MVKVEIMWTKFDNPPNNDREINVINIHGKRYNLFGLSKNRTLKIYLVCFEITQIIKPSSKNPFSAPILEMSECHPTLLSVTTLSVVEKHVGIYPCYHLGVC